jgi:hypothetical protein
MPLPENEVSEGARMQVVGVLQDQAPFALGHAPMNEHRPIDRPLRRADLLRADLAAGRNKAGHDDPVQREKVAHLFLGNRPGSTPTPVIRKRDRAAEMPLAVYPPEDEPLELVPTACVAANSASATLKPCGTFNSC